MNKIIHFGTTFKAVEEDETKDLIVQGMASTNDKATWMGTLSTTNKPVTHIEFQKKVSSSMKR